MHKEFIKPGIDHALGRAIEELGEVAAALGKTVRFGWHSVNPLLKPEDRETNEAWVRREIEDLKDALDCLIQELDRLGMLEDKVEPDVYAK